jgi:hypothetical protein
MKITRKSISDLAEIILEGGAVKATKYFSDKLIVRATRRTYGGKIVKGNTEIVLTIGKPNYEEREFIKKCKRTGDPFPVKKIQIKWPKGA